MTTFPCPHCGKPIMIDRPSEVATAPFGVTETREAAVHFAETRSFVATEIRVETRDGKTHLVGHAAVFDSPSLPLKTKSGKRFIEKIAPGAFKKSLEKNSDILMLRNHDPNTVLARTGAGTLKLTEDERGLRFDALLADTTAARDTAEDVRHGNMPGVSFGFNEPEDKWDKGEGDMPVRTLLAVPLGEVSPVFNPAYPATDIAVRAIDIAIERVEAGETDVRGNFYMSETRSRANTLRGYSREMNEATHQMMEHLRMKDDDLDDHEKRSLRQMHDEMRATGGKMDECRKMCRDYLGGDADADDVPPAASPGGAEKRAERVARQMRVNTDVGVDTVDLRKKMAKYGWMSASELWESEKEGQGDEPLGAAR